MAQHSNSCSYVWAVVTPRHPIQWGRRALLTPSATGLVFSPGPYPPLPLPCAAPMTPMACLPPHPPPCAAPMTPMANLLPAPLSVVSPPRTPRASCPSVTGASSPCHTRRERTG